MVGLGVTATEEKDGGVWRLRVLVEKDLSRGRCSAPVQTDTSGCSWHSQYVVVGVVTAATAMGNAVVLAWRGV